MVFEARNIRNGFENILDKLYAIFKLATLVLIRKRLFFLFGKKILELNP